MEKIKFKFELPKWTLKETLTTKSLLEATRQAMASRLKSR